MDETSPGRHARVLWALDFKSGRQAPVFFPSLAVNVRPGNIIVSPDGRQIAYLILEGDLYSIRLEEPVAPMPRARFAAGAEFPWISQQTGDSLPFMAK